MSDQTDNPELAAGSPVHERVCRAMLDLAARHASRAIGNVEPDPMVGAVVAEAVAGSDVTTIGGWRVLGIGHHDRFGGLHAEPIALERAKAVKPDLRDAVLFVTLEPCCHTGKQPPCTRAAIDSGVRRVVIAQRDPNPIARGGADVLLAAGVAVQWSDASRRAIEITAPWRSGLVTGRPWVIAKWAQTIDGRLATANGSSQWVSGPQSRQRVHRLRGRCDAVITGIGTVLADDPLLSVRDAIRRRTAPLRRVVLDRQLRVPTSCRLIETASEWPLTIFTSVSGAAAQSAKVDALRNLRVEIIVAEDVSVAAAAAHCGTAHGASTVLVEAGGRLLGDALRRGHVDECHVYTGPLVLAERGGQSIGTDAPVAVMADAARWWMVDLRRQSDEVRAVYRRALV